MRKSDGHSKIPSLGWLGYFVGFMSRVANYMTSSTIAKLGQGQMNDERMDITSAVYSRFDIIYSLYLIKYFAAICLSRLCDTTIYSSPKRHFNGKHRQHFIP